MPEPLTREDRERAIERALSLYEGRWIEQQVRAAASIDEAVAFLRERLAWSGYWGPQFRLMGMGAGKRGMYMEIPGTGRAGWITWREIAKYVRQPRQIGLRPVEPLT